MSEQEPILRIRLTGYDPTIISRTLDQITERINRHFETRTRSLFLPEEYKSSFDKCRDCVWFHQATKFCAVAPQNLTSFECGDRQLPGVPTNLDYLDARSPERIELVQSLAEKLEIDTITLERNLCQGWRKHPEAFGMTTRGLLLEIEKYGGYSIAQMELIGDAIRLNADHIVPCATAGAIRTKILTGQSFEEIIRWLLSTNSN